MADPRRYFPEPKQKELAGEVWDLAGRKTGFYSSVCQVNAFRFVSADARRILHGKDWMTHWRQDGGPDDNADVNRELGHTNGYYSGECIADVEHFFVAAFMEIVVGPHLTQVGVWGWETFDILLKGPVLKAVAAQATGRNVGEAFLSGFPSGLKGWFRSVEWNYGQALRAQAGIEFGATTIEGAVSALGMPLDAGLGVHPVKQLRNAVEVLRRANAEVSRGKQPSSPVMPVHSNPANPGTADREFRLDFRDPNKSSLSAIARAVYGALELWPLIWWHNPGIRNPNRLQGLTSVRYRDLGTYSPAEISSAKATAPTWKNFPL